MVPFSSLPPGLYIHWSHQHLYLVSFFTCSVYLPSALFLLSLQKPSGSPANRQWIHFCAAFKPSVNTLIPILWLLACLLHSLWATWGQGVIIYISWTLHSTRDVTQYQGWINGWMDRMKRETERNREWIITGRSVLHQWLWCLPNAFCHFPYFFLIPAPTYFLFPSLSSQMKKLALFLFLPKYSESKLEFSGRQGTRKAATSELLPHHQSTP